MKKLILFASCLSLFMVSACSGESDNSKEENSDEKKTSQAAAIPDSPCELVSSENIRQIVGVDAAFEITMQDKEYTYPTCKFEWEDQKVKKTMEVGGRTMEIDMPSEVLLVLVKDVNEKMFNRSTQVYKDGEDVSGVGEMAVWGDELAQLTFLKGSVMMHVHVKVNNDNVVNKKKAIEIAEFILEKI